MNNENNTKSKISKAGSLVLILCLALVGKMFGGYLYGVYSDSTTKNIVVDTLYQNLDEIRSNLPMVLDEYTTWEEVDFDGSAMLYSYTVKVSDLNDGDKRALISQIRNANTKPVCENPEIATVINTGIDYRYIYNDLNGSRIGSFVVSREICNGL
ncbi:hypothetical protein AADH33_13080 (plasmid) [Psychrobacter sp. KFRI-CH2-11]|uniref:hypothetical protein n=1 Tax=Psychrobacter sp. KFRI-CH2-11 TaxID=3156079 RepID=UPI00324829E8